MKAVLLHLRKYNDVIYIDWRPAELLVFAGLYPLMELPLQHYRLVVGVMFPEWFAWAPWIEAGIIEPEDELELEGHRHA